MADLVTVPSSELGSQRHSRALCELIWDVAIPMSHMCTHRTLVKGSRFWKANLISEHREPHWEWALRECLFVYLPALGNPAHCTGPLIPWQISLVFSKCPFRPHACFESPQLQCSSLHSTDHCQARNVVRVSKAVWNFNMIAFNKAWLGGCATELLI